MMTSSVFPDQRMAPVCASSAYSRQSPPPATVQLPPAT